MNSPFKEKKRFPYNREVYRMCVLLASDIIKWICEGKMTHDLTPDFCKAQGFAITVIMHESGLTKEEAKHFIRDFCIHWTLDKVPIFPNQTEDEVSTQHNTIAEEVLDVMLGYAIHEYTIDHPK